MLYPAADPWGSYVPGGWPLSWCCIGCWSLRWCCPIGLISDLVIYTCRLIPELILYLQPDTWNCPWRLSGLILCLEADSSAGTESSGWTLSWYSTWRLILGYTKLWLILSCYCTCRLIPWADTVPEGWPWVNSDPGCRSPELILYENADHELILYLEADPSAGTVSEGWPWVILYLEADSSAGTIPNGWPWASSVPGGWSLSLYCTPSLTMS